MRNKYSILSVRLCSALILLCILVCCVSGCVANNSETPSGNSEVNNTATEKDYASEVKLDMGSSTLKQEVTVKTFVDGDTTHFNVPNSVVQTGVLKARYLAINTPESTGKIEEFGKKASAFTKEKLSSASSIYIESDDSNWNLDSTGGRYLVWVWYKTDKASDYRNLNIEILQNGLAIASSSASNRYGSICLSALTQARTMKLNIQSGQKDPDFYYGDAVELTLKELRCNPDKYNGIKVAFQGVITMNNSNTVYIEDYDYETDMYYGIAVYYGYGLSGEGLDVLSVGNMSRIVGTVQYYETGGTYQVSGLTYRVMKPNDPGNIIKISEGHNPAFKVITADTFAHGKLTVEVGEENVEFGFAQLAMNTSVKVDNLTVKSVYTTKNEESSSFGAMTLSCECNGINISIRTIPLYDENNNLITESAFDGKNISVKGLVDYYDGTYQIKVFNFKDITVNN